MAHLLIRADAGARMGSGHLMRCLALAEAWRARGGSTTFLSHCESSQLRSRIEAAGHRFIPLENPHPDPRDLHTTLSVLEGPSIDAPQDGAAWLVLDGYHFDSPYQQALREAAGAAGRRLLVIDDLAHLPHYHADVLLNQNVNAERLAYCHDPDTDLLLGTRYVLLRPEFLAWKGWQREIPEIARKVLVTMGGSDPDNVTLKVMQALSQIEAQGLEAVIMVGAISPHYRELKAVVRCSPLSMRLVRNAANVPELMAWADVAISAGGSTCWELAFMGLPNLVMVLADNQRPTTTYLGALEAIGNLGWHETVSSEAIAEATASLSMNTARRAQMAHRGRSLVDAEGAERVLAHLSADYT